MPAGVKRAHICMTDSRDSRGVWGRLFGYGQSGEDADSLLRGSREVRAQGAEASNADPQSEVVLDVSSGARGADSAGDTEESVADTDPSQASSSNITEAQDDEEISEAPPAKAASRNPSAVLLGAGSSVSSDSSMTCLICLEPIDPTDTQGVVHMGCMCKGAAAYRHKDCLDEWLRVKGNTTCDVCGADMKVEMPPPPPVPGYVIFPDLDHGFETQWATFGRYVWQNAVAVVVYCIVLALIMDIPLQIAMLIAAFVLAMIMVRYVVSVAVNSIAGRTVLAFQVPETS